MQEISIDMYKGEVANVNSYVFSNGVSLAVMDVQRATDEAKKLGELIKAKNLPLEYILVSHGHPDHYIGMNHLMQEFPDAKIVVPSAEIKKDIIDFSTYMESIGWLDAEPALKPKSNENPDGFDYEAHLNVLDSNVLELRGGGTLAIDSDFAPAEAEHLSTVFVEKINALCCSDFGYNKVHLWMGPGVTDEHVSNWRKELLALYDKYVDLNPTVYPGHGDMTDVSVFRDMADYISNFQRVVEEGRSRSQVMAEMEKLYPDYANADFLLKNSVDFHVSE